MIFARVWRKLLSRVPPNTYHTSRIHSASCVIHQTHLLILLEANNAEQAKHIHIYNHSGKQHPQGTYVLDSCANHLSGGMLLVGCRTVQPASWLPYYPYLVARSAIPQLGLDRGSSSSHQCRLLCKCQVFSALQRKEKSTTAPAK